MIPKNEKNYYEILIISKLLKNNEESEENKLLVALSQSVNNRLQPCQ